MITLLITSSFIFIIAFFFYALADKFNKRRIWTAFKGVSVIFIFAVVQGTIGFIFSDILRDFFITYTLGGVVLSLYATYLYYQYLKDKWRVENSTSKRKRK